MEQSAHKLHKGETVTHTHTQGWDPPPGPAAAFAREPQSARALLKAAPRLQRCACSTKMYGAIHFTAGEGTERGRRGTRVYVAGVLFM